MSAQRRTRRRRRKHSALPWLFVLVLALLIGSYIFMTRSPLFNITSVTVEGAYKVTVSEVKEKAGIEPGQNLFSFHSSTVEKSIRELIMIKSVVVERILPGRVKIVVAERTPSLIFASPSGYYSVDEEGIVINLTGSPENPSAILVSGVDIGEPLIGELIDFSSTAMLATVRSVITDLEKKGDIQMISEIHVSSGGYYYLYTKKANVVKFYSLSSFESNLEFIDLFLNCENRPIMVEVIEGTEPVYSIIEIY